MPRREPLQIDTTRRLVAVDPETGATGKIWNGDIYIRGMEHDLPPDFPMDGPHWEDWEPDYDPMYDEVRGVAAMRRPDDDIPLPDEQEGFDADSGRAGPVLPTSRGHKRAGQRGRA
ncbi:MAG: hypothetical protein ABI119_05975 [Gemmatimonadaceae bacterium]